MVNWPQEIRFLGLSDEEIADELDVHPNTVKRWREGDRKPNASTAVKLAKLIEEYQ